MIFHDLFIYKYIVGFARLRYHDKQYYVCFERFSVSIFFLYIVFVYF